MRNRHRNHLTVKACFVLLSLVQVSLQDMSESAPSYDGSYDGSYDEDSDAKCTLEEITRDSCREDANEDNLSCPYQTGRYRDDFDPSDCFSRSLLCDGVQFCEENDDEGDFYSFEELDCFDSPPSFECGCEDIRVGLDALCNGVDDCSAAGVPPTHAGRDESASICNNKCLLPYYGGCDLTRKCMSHRFGVRCGGCLEGFIIDPDDSRGPCLPTFMFTFETTNMAVSEADEAAEVCVNLVSMANLAAVEPINVDIIVSGDELPIPDDIVSITPTLTFTSNDLEDCIQIDINNDLEGEQTEDFTIILDLPEGGQFVSNGPATLTIFDDDTPLMIQFSDPMLTVSEMGEAMQICLEITSGTVGVGGLIIEVMDDGGTALSGSDFDPLSEELSFMQGATPSVNGQECFPFSPTDDTEVESPETVNLIASSPDVPVLFPDGGDQATINIVDNDVLVRFSVDEYSVREDNSVEVCIVIVMGTVGGEGIAIDIEDVVGGTATVVMDFEDVAEVLFFPPGSSPAVDPERCFNFMTVDDPEVEPTENAPLMATSVDPRLKFTDGGDMSTVNIFDDEIEVEFTQTTFGVTEDGTDPGVLVCIEILSGTVEGEELVIDIVNIEGGTATVSMDFDPINEAVTFDIGATVAEVECFLFDPRDDSNAEDPETVILMASPPNEKVVFPAGGDKATVVINDDDILVRFTTTTFEMEEGSDQTEVCVIIDMGTVGEDGLVINIVDIIGGTATPNDDFPSMNEELMFPTNATEGDQQCFDFMAIDDTALEPTENVTLRAFSPSPDLQFAPGGDFAFIDILDNEVQVQFSQMLYSVSEDGSAAEIFVCVEIVAGTVGSDGLTVTVEDEVGGSATALFDFTPIDIDLSFGANATVGEVLCFNFEPNDDTDLENTESFTLRASSTAPELLFTTGGNTTTVQIMDDEIVAEFSQDPFLVLEDEDASMVLICVNIVRGTVGMNGLDVIITDIGGSADASDFDDFTTVLSFEVGAQPGSNEQECFFFEPIDDFTVEDTEDIIISASSPDPELSFTPDQGTASIEIIDDDVMAELSVTSPEVTEGGVVEVCVDIVAGTVGTAGHIVTVSNDETRGSATAPSDFDAFTMDLSFAPGAQSDNDLGRQCFPFVATDDTSFEDTEDVVITASSPDPELTFTPELDEVSIDIIDDEIVAQFIQATFPVSEDGSADPVQVCIEIVAGEVGADGLMITVERSGGSAMEGDDFEAFNVELLFTSGSNIECYPFDPIDDIDLEDTETIDLEATSTNPELIFINEGDVAVIVILDDDIRFGFVDPVFDVTENGDVEVCVEIEAGIVGPGGQVINVDNTMGGTANVGSDFDAISITLSFDEGDQEGDQECFVFNPSEDPIVEDTENIPIIISSDDPEVSFNPTEGVAIISILDNDAPSAILSVSSDVVSEDDQAPGVVVCANLLLPLPDSVTINVVNVPGGSATAGLDFPIVNEFLVFTPGETQQCFVFEPMDDGMVESTEGVNLLASSDNAVLTFILGNTVSINILDDDVRFMFSEPSLVVQENGAVDVCVEIDAGTVGPGGVLINVVNVAGGTATVGSDFNPINVTLSFGASATVGEQQCFPFNPTNDPFPEFTEDLMLSASSHDQEVSFTTAGDMITINIIDDDPIIDPPDVRFMFSDPSLVVQENGAVDVCIEIDAGIVGPGGVLINVVNVAGGTATVGSDFNPINVTLSFGASATVGEQQCFPFNPTNDPFPEFTEDLMLSASSHDQEVSFTTAGDMITINIIDDDPIIDPPDVRFRFSEPSLVVQENGAVDVCVEIDAGTVGPGGVLINVVNVAGGTATVGSDFNPINVALFFGSSATVGEQQCFPFNPTNDPFPEVTEDLMLSASSNDVGVSFTTAGDMITINIIDDDPIIDPPAIRGVLSVSSEDVSEDDQAPGVEVCANLEASSSTDLFITVGNIAGGTAAVGPDFAPVNEVLLFQSGVTEQCFTFEPNDDTSVEPPENLMLLVVDSSNEILFDQGDDMVSILILDDDIGARFVSPTVNVLENNMEEICVVINAGTVGPGGLIINVENIGGTATVGSDFAAANVNVPLFFPVGSTIGADDCFTFDPIDDPVPENTEDLILRASSNNPELSFTPTGDTMTINILDDDEDPEEDLFVRIVPPSEGIDPAFTISENGGPQQVCVQLVDQTGGVPMLSSPATVSLSTADGNAQSTGILPDFTEQQFFFTIEPSQVLEQFCDNIPIINDGNPENTESFFLILTTFDNRVTPLVPVGSVTIIDDDSDLFVRIVPPVGQLLPAFTIQEDEGSQQVCVELVDLSGGVPMLSSSATVSLSTEDATATSVGPLADFTAQQFSFTIQPSQTTQQFCGNIPIIDDRNLEGSESLSLVITSLDSRVTPLTPFGSVTITDDEDDLDLFVRIVPPAGQSQPAFTIPENSGSQQVCVQLVDQMGGVPMLSSPATVSLSTADGTAISTGSQPDFTSQQLSFTIQPSQVSQQFCVNIPIIDNNIFENTETFSLILASLDTRVTPLIPVGSVTINDDDDPEDLFVRIVPPSEGLDPAFTISEDGGPQQVCVQLVDPTGGVPMLSSPATVSLSTADGTAISTGPQPDFTSQQFSFTIQPSQVSQQFCDNIPIIDDSIFENTETFSLILASLDTRVTPLIPVGSVTIIDDEDTADLFARIVPPSGELQPAFTISEDGGFQQVCVQLVDPMGGVPMLSSPATVSLSTADGTAISTGSQPDFTSQQLSFTIQPSQVSQLFCVNIPIIDNNIFENTETFSLILASLDSRVNPLIPVGSVTINDDDDPEEDLFVRIVPPSEGLDPAFTIPENGGFQQVCVQLVDPMGGVPMLSSPATVSLSTADGTAISTGSQPDFTNQQFSFTIQASQQFCVNIPIIDNNIPENTETFSLILASLDSRVTPLIPVGSVTINDDDDPEGDLFVRIVPPSGELDPAFTISEDGGPQQVCVQLVDPTGGVPMLSSPATVSLSTADGTAISTGPQPDFAEEQFFFTIQPFQVTQQFCDNIAIIDDGNFEDIESFSLVLTSLDNRVTPLIPVGSVTIIDDDDNIFVRIVSPTGEPQSIFTIPEDGGSQPVCVQLVDQLGGVPVFTRAVTVILSTADGTASGTGSQPDFTAQQLSFTIPPSLAAQVFCDDIPINDDGIFEGPETFSLILSSSDGGVTPLNPIGSVTIVDQEDASQVSTPTAVSVPEDAEVLLIPLQLNGPGRQCVVTVSTLDGTAISTGFNDFIGISTVVTLDGSTRITNIAVEIRDDRLMEGLEDFRIFLSTSSPGCLVSSEAILVSIEDNDGVGVGDDPHFSIVLPSGKLLCYTVQGEHGFSFNLISNKKMSMNARFVPDSRRSEVTWMGSIGIIVRDSMYKQANATALRFEAKENKIYIGDKVTLLAKNIETITFKNGKLTISEAPPTDEFKYPSIYIDLQDVGISFTMKFKNEHLDLFWHSIGGNIADSHGIIGQFFRTGVVVDEVRKILIMPNKEPVPVMRRPVWSFMEREETDDQLCWTAMNPGYQGEGLIDGTYYDYLVDNVMANEFQFKKQ